MGTVSDSSFVKDQSTENFETQANPSNFSECHQIHSGTLTSVQ